MKNALIYLLMFATVQIGTSFGTMFVWSLITGSSNATVSSTIISMAVCDICIMALFLLTRWTSVSPNYLRTRPWAVAFWSAMAAIGLIIPSIWFQEQMPALPNIVEEQMTAIIKDRWGYLVIGILAPLSEEFVFRGAILRTLLGWDRKPYEAPSPSWWSRPWTAIIISAFLFALIHMNPAQLPHAFIIGILLGWMYWRTGSIIPGMVYHWVNNSVAYVTVNIMPDPNIPLTALFDGNRTTVLLSVMFSLCIAIPAIFQLHLRMKR